MSKQKFHSRASTPSISCHLHSSAFKHLVLKGALPAAMASLLGAFSIARSQTTSPAPALNPKLPTLFLIGDSTVRNGRGDGANGQWGWGDLIAPFFDQSKINIVNSAIGGRSSRTYMTDGHWDQVLARLKPGDFVIMQFGHNDGGDINDTSRARGTLHGIGPETQEIDNLITKQHEVVHTFGWYLRKFTADTRARGATPIICSLIPRKIWKDGRIVRNSDTYAGWAADVARVEHVAFVDLNEIIARKYDELGPDPVEPLFADPHTHTSLAGAQLNARCVVEGLRSLKPNPLATFIRSQPLDSSKPPAPAPPPRGISFNFDFGPGKPVPGHIRVLSSTLYNAGLGYGFERGSVVSCEGPGGANSHIGSCSAPEPFFFSVALPEVNYNVTVSLGDQAAESTTTVRAELRRLMLESIHAARGETQTMTFTVNVRTPRISTGGEVKLKDREKTSEAWAWDEKLTLEFRGTQDRKS